LFFSAPRDDSGAFLFVYFLKNDKLYRLNF